jgi:phosphate/sulfate permease
VSSSQVVVGCIIGIGLYKGARNINFRILGEIGLAWLISPISSGLLAFLMLFFMKNIFSLEVGYPVAEAAQHLQTANDLLLQEQAGISAIVKYLILGLLIFGALGISFYVLLENKKKREMQKSEARFWRNMK